MAINDSYSDCKLYADKLQHRLQWAFDAAQKYIDKETTQYKKYYDKNFCCATLREGDLVLIRINKFGTDHNIADKWEQDPWEVIDKCNDSPLLMVCNVVNGDIKELHQNMLYPLRMVDPDDHLPTSQNIKSTPTLIKANQLMVETMFTCDCKKCVETV